MSDGNNDATMAPPPSSPTMAPPPPSPTMVPPPTDRHGKRPRGTRSPEPEASSSKRPRKDAAHPPKKPGKKSKKPKQAHDWHLTKAEVPPDSEKTKVRIEIFRFRITSYRFFQVALEIHIRVLWGLVGQSSIPPTVSNIEKSHYDGRFDSKNAIRTSVSATLDSQSGDIQKARDAVLQLHEKVKNEQGRIATNIKRIPEPVLLMMFRTVASYGLKGWKPDLLSSDASSMYNFLHETIALLTFEQATAAYGYAHIGMNMNNIRDYALLRKFYRNFVFSYMTRIAKLEARNTGAVAKAMQQGPVWKRQAEVCASFEYCIVTSLSVMRIRSYTVVTLQIDRVRLKWVPSIL